MQNQNSLVAGAYPDRAVVAEHDLEARADALKEKRGRLLKEFRATSEDLRANKRQLASVVKVENNPFTSEKKTALVP